MIDTVLCAARDTLRRYLGPQPNGEEIAHLTCPGKGVDGQRNYLGLMFIGLEHEANLRSTAQGFSLDANIVFMLYSVFSDYNDSLSYLSMALGCFQDHIRFSASDFPDLSLPSYPLYIEPYFFPLEQHLQTWNPFMDDSIPFMFYKIRSLQFKTLKQPAPPVSVIDAALNRMPP
ncbi:Pvc16 family protein [Desulfosarcina sp. OttesenSCG-928-G10]|nr:Pvc16 family protein [Desulfosarcina sp. OttesenSCG-928-G10]